MYQCPCCQQTANRTQVKIQSVQEAVNQDPLIPQNDFKRTYIGHGLQSSVFVFQGHRGPFKRHVHVHHDEIGYVLKGSGTIRVGDTVREVKTGDVWVIPANTPHSGDFQSEPVEVLFMSAPQDDPDRPDRVWLEE